MSLNIFTNLLNMKVIYKGVQFILYKLKVILKFKDVIHCLKCFKKKNLINLKISVISLSKIFNRK